MLQSVTEWLFPLVATVHPFLDLGYFVFLHGSIAREAKLSWLGMLGVLDASSLSKHFFNAIWVTAELGISNMQMSSYSWLRPVGLNCAYVAFAAQIKRSDGSWIYPPLAKVPWRIAFPLATLPVWALVAQFAKWRDTVSSSDGKKCDEVAGRQALTSIRRVAVRSSGRVHGLLMVTCVRCAVLFLLLASPLAYLSLPARMRRMKRLQTPAAGSVYSAFSLL